MSDFMLRLAATVFPAVVMGVAAVWLAHSIAHRRSDVETARLAITRALLAVVVATLLTWTLVLSNPNPDAGRALNIVPLREITRAMRSETAGYGLVNLWGNVLVFVPVGVLALLSMRTTVRHRGIKAFAAGVSLSVAIEATQYGIGRSADIDDVILNAIGIVLGVAAVVLARRLPRRQRSIASDSG